MLFFPTVSWVVGLDTITRLQHHVTSFSDDSVTEIEIVLVSTLGLRPGVILFLKVTQ